MRWTLLLPIAVLCVIGHYGPSLLLYIFTAVACFLLSFVFFLNDTSKQLEFLTTKCTISKGIPSVTAIMDCEGVPKPNIKMSDSTALDVVFNQMISYTIRDYVSTWYGPLTPDTIFTTELHRLLQRIVSNVVQRISTGDWVTYFTEILPTELASHIRLHRLALERHANKPDKDFIKIFFDAESELEKNVNRERISTIKEEEQRYLRRISDMFLFFILPPEEYRVPAVRYIAREILVNAVLLPTVDLLADPDFVNRSIAWLAKDSAFSSEYFIQALRLSDSAEELEVVIQQLNSFSDKLRGHDTGSDDDISVKAQLGSLEYVRKIASQRLKQIKEGVAEKPENVLAYNLQPGVRLYDMPFKELLSTSVALVSFLEFMTSIEKHSILRLYLNCLSYRENAQNLIDEETDVSSMPWLAFGEPSASEQDDGSDVAGDSTAVAANNSDSPSSSKSVDAADSLRSFGVTLCGSLLKQLPTSVEPLVQQVLRTITISTGPPDPNVFAEIESTLADILSGAQYFGAFKRSPHYVQLLAELDLLKDPSEQNSSPLTADESNSTMDVECPPIQFKEPKKDDQPIQLVTSPGPNAESYTAQIVRSEIMRDSYVVYTLKVSCTSTVVEHSDSWQTLRRFSQFADLHALITDKYGTIPKLRLPSKRAFSNMSRDFLAKRRRDLNEYLSTLCSSEFLTSYPQARPLVVEFLQPDSWERDHAHARSPGAFNPFRSVGSAVRSMPDTIADGFFKVFGGEAASRRASSFETGRMALAGYDPARACPPSDSNTSDEGPIAMVFLLVDEVFNLRKNHLSREGNFVILRKIFQAIFGPRINKMIISKVNELTSAQRMAEFVSYLRDSIWPPVDPTQRNEQPAERDRKTKLRTRVLCRTMLLGSVADDLAQFLGNETTRRGVKRLFRLMQEESLNRRFVHCLLEGILYQMFHPYRIHWHELIEKELCPVYSGRKCHLHTTA